MYSPNTTLFKVLFTAPVFKIIKQKHLNNVYINEKSFQYFTSNGGFPTTRVYNIQPTDQTSDSIPWGPRVATSLYNLNKSWKMEVSKWASCSCKKIWLIKKMAYKYHCYIELHLFETYGDIKLGVPHIV